MNFLSRIIGVVPDQGKIVYARLETYDNIMKMKWETKSNES